MAKIYQAFNGPTPTTAAIPKITTGNTIKTLMQLATPSTAQLRVIEWGISFDGTAAATPIQCELIDTTGAATVTAYVAGDMVKLTGPSDVATALTLGTTASGYTSSGEGTPGASRILDYQMISPTNQYIKQYPLGREPEVAISRFLRIRVTAGTAVSATCYICWEE